MQLRSTGREVRLTISTRVSTVAPPPSTRIERVDQHRRRQALRRRLGAAPVTPAQLTTATASAAERSIDAT